MIKPNWDIFRAKFSDNPQDYFEWFCYMLFCEEMSVSHIHRYKNQAAIETDPIQRDDETIAWQAKFYDTPLSNHKSDFIGMLDRVNEYYPSVNRVLIYTNQEWAQNAGKEPKGKAEIEKKAEEYSIDIDWRTASFFESSFVSNENSIISRHFFVMGDSIFDVIDNLEVHTQVILKQINTDILFNGTKLKINRELELNSVKNSDAQVLILSGAGGVGKTAIIKELYENDHEDSHMYLFKASEFDLSLDEIFRRHSMKDFMTFHKDFTDKYFVIDSAEKLLSLRNTERLNEFLTIALKENWRIIFTTRDSYLEELNFRFTEVYNIYPENIAVKGIDGDELESLSKEYGFILPKDHKVISLIKNPFYLNEYLKNYNDDDEKFGYVEFKEKLWNKVIKKANGSREQAFINIAKKRAESSQFFINPEIDQSILSELQNDGLIEYELTGYFITHDIYEEWALEKYVDIQYLKSVNASDFFHGLISTLPSRRALRNWVSDKILSRSESIIDLVVQAIFDDEIQDFWKDEMVVSILMSDYAENFTDTHGARMLDNDMELLNRCCRLLRISCKNLDRKIMEKLNRSNKGNLDYYFTQPVGEGWHAIIRFLYENIERIEISNYGKYIKLLYDWNFKKREGKTSRYASLISLKYYEWVIEKDVFLNNDEIKDMIFAIIVYGAEEIKEELSTIIDNVVENRWSQHRDPYVDLCEYCLSEIEGIFFAKALPNSYIKLAQLFWYKDKDFKPSIYSHREDLEDYFGVRKDYQMYYPSSAYQTHLYTLLNVSSKDTLDFIIDFANTTSHIYIQSKLSNREIIEITTYLPSGKIRKLHISHRLWCMYRGTQTAPDIVESAHMALERWLYEVGEQINEKQLSDCLLYILNKSNSTSLNAIVVAIVNAYPDKTYEVAKLLFKTKEFFAFDRARMSLDRTGKSLFTIGYGMNAKHKYHQDERLDSFSFSNRNKSLEDTFLYYSLFKRPNISDEEHIQRQKELYEILDEYYSEISDQRKDFEWKLALSRMDLRKMDIESEPVDEGIMIKLNPQLDRDTEEKRSHEIEILNTKNKYIKLSLWADYRFKKDEKYVEYPEFEDNIDNLIEQFLEVNEHIKDSKSDDFYLIHRSLPSKISSILLRDYFEIIPEDIKILCKDIILKSVEVPFSQAYGYQFGDGIDIAIKTLPLILSKFHKVNNVIKRDLCFTLLDDHPMGANGEFSEYALIAMKDPIINDRADWIKELLFSYIYLAPKFDEYREKKFIEERKNYGKHFGHYELVNGFTEDYSLEISRAFSGEIDKKDLEVDKLEISIIRKALSLIPIETKSEELVAMQDKLIQVGNNQIIGTEERINYLTRYRYFEYFTELVLKTSRERRDILMHQIIDQFCFTESMVELIKTFIRMEDQCNCYDAFWQVWNTLSDILIKKCIIPQEGSIIHSYKYRQVDLVIKSILLANVEWNLDVKEWHTLKTANYVFFEKFINQLPNYPSVLYSTVRLINGVGSIYFRKGITWLSKIIVSVNKTDSEYEIDRYTITLIENAVRKYVLVNRDHIRRTRMQKEEVITILDWLVNRGSVIGYMVREYIL